MERDATGACTSSFTVTCPSMCALTYPNIHDSNHRCTVWKLNMRIHVLHMKVHEPYHWCSSILFVIRRGSGKAQYYSSKTNLSALMFPLKVRSAYLKESKKGDRVHYNRFAVPLPTLSPTTPTSSLSTLQMGDSDKRNVPQQPSSNPPGAPSPLPCCFSSKRSFRRDPWEDYCPRLDLFVYLHGSSNRSRRRSRRAATGAIRTWIPYLWISEHGPCSTTSRIGFQTLRTLPRGHLPHQCSQ